MRGPKGHFMAFSGIIKDTDSGIFDRGSYPVRVITFTLFSAVLGWVFTTYMPQMSELSLHFAAAFGIGLLLVLITSHVSTNRGERMFASLFFAAGFIVGMWGMWIDAEFGAIPTIDQIRTNAEGRVYSLNLFREPTELRDYIFEMWIAVTVLMASIPFLASLPKPAQAGARQNPFRTHPDFAQAFLPRLIFLPLLGFGIAAGAVYGVSYMAAYALPLELVIIPPMIVAALFTKLHMNFIKALIISVFGGVAAAAGFWLPWLYMARGQDGMIAFLNGTPQDIFARAQAEASGYTYASEIAGIVTDYSPWAFEVWAGLTLAFLCLPLLITLFRRVFYTLRPV